jgi:alkanesulfonate monooxygenase SsuD/methylene tetrahydromethanopterin reductase-like flavin-dependent oxidoreductase (luciferase family)
VAKAREIARGNLRDYVRLPNYQNNLRQFGFTDDDFENNGSDRLVDEIVAWGDEAAIRDRIEAHWRAGADHVCIQPFRADGGPGPDLALLERLAPNG